MTPLSRAFIFLGGSPLKNFWAVWVSWCWNTSGTGKFLGYLWVAGKHRFHRAKLIEEIELGLDSLDAYNALAKVGKKQRLVNLLNDLKISGKSPLAARPKKHDVELLRSGGWSIGLWLVPAKQVYYRYHIPTVDSYAHQHLRHIFIVGWNYLKYSWKGKRFLVGGAFILPNGDYHQANNLFEDIIARSKEENKSSSSLISLIINQIFIKARKVLWWLWIYRLKFTPSV